MSERGGCETRQSAGKIYGGGEIGGLLLHHGLSRVIYYSLIVYRLNFSVLISFISTYRAYRSCRLQIASREPGGKRLLVGGVLRSRLPSELRYKMDAQVKYTYEKSRFSIKNIKILIIFCIFFTKKNRK